MTLTIDDMSVFCKKKGFVYPSSEIYGGFSGFFDYGPLGVELKNNIKAAFWKRFVTDRENIVGIDGTIVTHPMVWKASVHVDNFTDYIYTCGKCKTMIKGEEKEEVKCPKCKGNMEKQGKFNLMFETNVGPVKGNTAYLRPETAQVIFADFKRSEERRVGKECRSRWSP